MQYQNYRKGPLLNGLLRQSIKNGARDHAGVGMGGCLAGIAEYFDRRFKSVDDAERELEIPFLGFIPYFQIEGRKADRLIAVQDPSALASEAYRTIKTLIQLSTSIPKRGNTLLITSATPGEGKSTTAANLAISFAQLGLEVLLVDADLRRPVLDRVFNLEGCIGLAEILKAGVDWKSYSVYLSITTSNNIALGVRPPNPTNFKLTG
jgi:nitrogenase subunit NifH